MNREISFVAASIPLVGAACIPATASAATPAPATAAAPLVLVRPAIAR